jgi:hypothetical protein
MAATQYAEDAAEYIVSLTEAEHWQQEWPVAMEAVILIAERGGPTMLARIGVMRALNRNVNQVINPGLKLQHWRKAQAEERPMTVFVYVNTSRQIGDVEHIKVFANQTPRRNSLKRCLTERACRGHPRTGF